MKLRIVDYSPDLPAGSMYKQGNSWFVVGRDLIHRSTVAIADPAEIPRDGIDGRPGRDGADGRAGLDAIPLAFTGRYSHGRAYKVNEVVLLNGNSFVCVSDCKGVRPRLQSNHWRLIARRGLRGAEGLPGFRGPRGIGADGTMLAETLTALLIDGADSAGIALYSAPDGTGYKLAQAIDGMTHVSALSFEAIAIGAQGKIITEGVLTLESWASVLESGEQFLNPGQTLYLSATMPGKLTHTAPTADGFFVCRVAQALSPTQADTQIEAAIKL